MADMAVQCFAGNCARGMSLAHNGGRVGIRERLMAASGLVVTAVNGWTRCFVRLCFGDVMMGVARRS